MHSALNRYKGGRAPLREAWLSPPRLGRCRHRTSPPVHSCSQVTPLAPSPCTTQVPRAAPLTGAEAPATAAAARRLRSRPNPIPGHKSVVGKPHTLSLHFPDPECRRVAGILAGAAALHGPGTQLHPPHSFHGLLCELGAYL
jgi:hypothetical protein